MQVGDKLKPSEYNMEGIFDKTVRYKVTQIGCGRVYITNLDTGDNSELTMEEAELYYDVVGKRSTGGILKDGR